MAKPSLFKLGSVTENLLASIQSRDVALWISKLPDGMATTELATAIGLPWKLVLSEAYDPALFEHLRQSADLNDPMTWQRGFVEIVDEDPSKIQLPQRCVPVYLLNGRRGTPQAPDFGSRLRRMNMLEQLRRSDVRDLVILSAPERAVPEDLNDLWASGFRTSLTFVSSEAAEPGISTWLEDRNGALAANLLVASPQEFVRALLTKYSETYPATRRIIRVRDAGGALRKIDVTNIDEPERPILERFDLIEEKDLSPILPEALRREDFVAFFQSPSSSWKPYAAGLPWRRDNNSDQQLDRLLRRLDSVGASENCIAYIAAESGAGGTTLAHALGWECARSGYPVLLAKQVPFTPDALSVGNFLNRFRLAASRASEQQESNTEDGVDNGPELRRYETPWVIVFDSLHWQGRDSELVRFRNELEKQGRAVCILVVTGPMLGLSFYNTSIFKKIAELDHTLTQDEARHLGRHLNRFLKHYGMDRSEYEWDTFYHEHTVRYLDGVAAFWVTLSFWIQGQYDLSESIQQWMYRAFRAHATDRGIQIALLQIAAISAERIPLPEPLLPQASGKWPISHVLEDARKNFGALGLVRIASDGNKYWALVHDILGRLLINALFYDHGARTALGFADVQDAEHLRLQVLRQISQHPSMGETAYRSLGEDFATSIFKIDPDHGHGNFVFLWREVLQALDSMPRPLRDTSRLFRHHTAVSRRRIAKLNPDFYGVSPRDQIALLKAAIDDINYALTFIDYTPGSEPDLNLLNSLANAYLDLAQTEAGQGADATRLAELRNLANEATRRAYAQNPTSTFVVETYIKNLLEIAESNPSIAVESVIEALGIVFSCVTSNEAAYRKSQLGQLGDRALSVLLKQKPPSAANAAPRNTTDVLMQAWVALASGRDERKAGALEDVPEANRLAALDILSDPIALGNMQAIRLRYDLLAVTKPYALREQLELLEQLNATSYRVSPQLRLEYAILLYQNRRAVEGNRVFSSLRPLWREGEHFVQVPARLRWLRMEDGRTPMTVHALTGSDYGNRAYARVQEFNNALVPFRPEEHGMDDFRAGYKFVCLVSFGHNGPFLRPVTAATT